ncbi:MAG: hypothetical protein LBD92_04590 [Oscillospiraceae bacterium]|nr:hypothetical protein [Oscillospiraceae bacterium]
MDNIEEMTGLSKEYLENWGRAHEASQNLRQSFGSSGLLDDGEDYPEQYGGRYINDKGKLVVLVVGDVDTAKAEIEKRAKSGDVIYKTCEYSYRMLTETMDEINLYMQENPISAVEGIFNLAMLMDTENRVVVYLAEFSQERIDEFKEKVSSAPCIEFVKSSGKNVDTINVNPGAGIVATGGSISVGYRVNRISADGILTAAHGATSTTPGSNGITIF